MREGIINECASKVIEAKAMGRSVYGMVSGQVEACTRRVPSLGITSVDFTNEIRKREAAAKKAAKGGANSGGGITNGR